MKKIYNQRLLTFANYLAKITNHPERGIFETVFMIELENPFSLSHEVTYNCWVFEELPACFDEWFYEEKFGNPAWEGAVDKEGTIASVIDFFDLTYEEFSHLFSIDGFQHTDRFGGKKLSENSDGPEIAENIIKLVHTRVK